jgi:predicted amidohydrolase
MGFWAYLLVFSVVCVALEVDIVSIDLFANQQKSIDGNIDVTLSMMDSYAKAASARGTEIIAFQEGLLWWFAPTIDLAMSVAPDFVFVRNGTTASGEILNPCLSHGESLLKSVSCISRLYSIVIVSNMATRNCDVGTNCKLFNTAVVTGRSGELLATYRKYHVYGSSPQFDQPSIQDLSYFIVDDVVVGLLVCFDLEYADPLDALIQYMPSLQAVVVPMFWTNTPPVSWSLLYLNALSYMHPHLTIFGVNDGSSSSTWGSGVYRAGSLVSNEEAWSVPYANVLHTTLSGLSHPRSPKLPNHAVSLGNLQSASTQLRPFNCTIPFYGNSLCVNLPDSSGHAQLKSGHASCSVNYDFEVSESIGESYLIAIDVIFASVETITPLHILACSVVRCLTPSGESGQVTCEFVVQQLNLQLDSPKNYLVFPLVGKASGNTLDAQYWSYVDANENDGTSSLTVGAVKIGVATLIAVEQVG